MFMEHTNTWKFTNKTKIKSYNGETLFLLTIVAANPFSPPNETLNYKRFKI